MPSAQLFASRVQSQRAAQLFQRFRRADKFFKIYHGGDGTPTGIYRIGGNADYNWNESGNYTPGGYRTTYWAINDVTYFTGFLLNLGFHSTVGYQGGYSDANQLGKHITHGCIRLAEDCAKWIYYNALPGTKVYVF